MPRQARPCTPNIPHHLITRFVNRQWRICDQRDRSRYLDFAGKGLADTETRACAFALMSSHTHWVAVPGEAEPLSLFLHATHSAFGRWWNRDRKGLGPVFAERPKSVVVDGEEQLARLIAYVHNNPVRAGVVRSADESDWTSHRAYLNLQAAPSWLDVSWSLAAMGFSSAPSGRLAFHEYVLSRASLPRDPRLAGRGAICPRLVVHLSTAVAAVAQAKKRWHGRSLLIYVGVLVLGLSRKRIADELKLSTSYVSREVRTMQQSPPPPDVVDVVVEHYLRSCAGECGLPKDGVQGTSVSATAVSVVQI